jgi:Asp-tRNA(Asn)/Glu-tRNA(Gln) amidotransferase A subunit family amidase
VPERAGVVPAADATVIARLRAAGAEHRVSYTTPYSLAGWPCMVVRCGTAPKGLPIGVQVSCSAAGPAP